jgi:hypothetical protein
MSSGGNIEENHLIGSLVVVAQRQFNGVADIAEFARFGFTKLDAAGYVAIMHVQARYHTFCYHGYIETAVAP